MGIEDNKPEAIAAMKQAAEHNSKIIIQTVPTIYPSGGEKQLIKLLTNREVPSIGIPADIGILVHNTGTLFAVQQAVYEGKPLIERIVTVTGNTIHKPGNKAFTRLPRFLSCTAAKCCDGRPNDGLYATHSTYWHS